jgi:hypothetical protein
LARTQFYRAPPCVACAFGGRIRWQTAQKVGVVRDDPRGLWVALPPPWDLRHPIAQQPREIVLDERGQKMIRRDASLPRVENLPKAISLRRFRFASARR